MYDQATRAAVRRSFLDVPPEDLDAKSPQVRKHCVSVLQSPPQVGQNSLDIQVGGDESQDIAPDLLQPLGKDPFTEEDREKKHQTDRQLYQPDPLLSPR